MLAGPTTGYHLTDLYLFASHSGPVFNDLIGSLFTSRDNLCPLYALIYSRTSMCRFARLVDAEKKVTILAAKMHFSVETQASSKTRFCI